MALFGDLVHAPEAPPILILATLRPGADAVEQAIRKTTGDVRRLELEPLSPEESRMLARELLLHRAESASPGRIAEEAAGHPLFIQEMVRHALAAGETQPVRLDEALWARIRRLEPPAHSLLQAAAVAGGPLRKGLLCRVAQVGPDDAARCVSMLRTSQLIRAGETIEPYHDRVREAVLAHLGSMAKRYRRLGPGARKWRATGATDRPPARLVPPVSACARPRRCPRAIGRCSASPCRPPPESLQPLDRRRLPPRRAGGRSACPTLP